MRILSIVILAALSIPVSLLAQTASQPSQNLMPPTSSTLAAPSLPPLPPPRFIAPQDVDLARALPPFPSTGSFAEQADLETMLALQIRRTKAEEGDAAADSVTTMVDFTKKLLGPSVTPTSHPKLFAMMQSLHDDMRGINRAANAAQGFRPRPTVHDPRIRPSLDMLGHAPASYPSARASSSGVWAYVIGELIPAQKANAEAEAERVAWRRVVGGVHYPSDLAGSRRVIAAVKQRLANTPAFMAKLAEVRAELASPVKGGGSTLPTR